MYIVFLAPETNNSEIKTQYEAICKRITDQKNTLFDGAFPSDPTKHEDHASQLTREIKKADALVVEATESNFNLGRLITIAIQQHKPVLMLQKEQKSTPVVIGSSRLIIIKPYKTNDEITESIKDFFKIAKKQRLNYRFNLMLSRDIDVYLSEKSKDRAISKADYIRELLIQDMEN